MGTRWPTEMFGVTIIYIRDHVARKCVTVLPTGHHVWALLPDGKVGTSDAGFFGYRRAEESREGVRVAERLWRLGKMPKRQYDKLAAAMDRKDKRKAQKSAAHDFVTHAQQAGIALTAAQRDKLAKLGVAAAP